MPTLAVYLPAFNEAETIGALLDAIPAAIPGITALKTIVVDDGSTDRTAEVARAHGAQVVRHAGNRGTGRAFMSGVQAALASGADVIVGMDADGQFSPADVAKLVAPIVSGDADVALCTRFGPGSQLTGRMPAVKRFGNWMLSRIISVTAGRRFTDVSCGFRAFTREAAQCVDIRSEFEYTHESLLTWLRHGQRVVEVPLPVQAQRAVGESRILSNVAYYTVRAAPVLLSAIRDHSAARDPTDRPRADSFRRSGVTFRRIRCAGKRVRGKILQGLGVESVDVRTASFVAALLLCLGVQGRPLVASQLAPNPPTPPAAGDVEARLRAMQGEIDLLQSALVKKEQGWYRDPAVVISVLALLFSFGTTAVSYYRTRRQDLHDARAELRVLIQRLGALPRENAELMQKYSEHPLTAGMFSALVNQENALIAKQAAEVVDRIRAHASATEYLAVANALNASGIFPAASVFYERAVAAARDVNDAANALRTYAASLFQAGDPGRGRIQFQMALNVFSKYQTANAAYVASTHIVTERSWAQTEFASGSAQEAKAHLEKAAWYAAQLPPGEFTDQLNSQIREAATSMKIVLGAAGDQRHSGA